MNPFFLRFGEDPPWRSRFGGVALGAAGGQWLRRAGGRRARGCGSTGAGLPGSGAVDLLTCRTVEMEWKYSVYMPELANVDTGAIRVAMF